MLGDSPKLLLVITEDWYFCSHRLALARSAMADGFRVFVATSPGPLRPFIEKEGFVFFPLRLRRNSKNPLRELLSIFDLAVLYKSISPDLVHHVALKPVLYGSIAALVAGVPAILNAVTGLGYTFIGDSKGKRVLRHLMRLTCAVAFASGKMRIAFQNPDDRRLFIHQRIVQPEQTCLIVGSGVDSALFSPKPEPPGPPVILLPSRMLWDKGVGELVEAARILKKLNLDFKIVLAGRIDLSNPAFINEAQLREWEAENLLRWIGHVDDMPSLYANCHIVCLPSYREGLPLALIEAASCGLPIVSTDTPGCREIVRDNVNGILVPVKDSPALAEALRRLIIDASARHGMGKKGRAMVLKHFTREMAIRQTLDIYSELLGGRFSPQQMSCMHGKSSTPGISATTRCPDSVAL